MPVHEEGSTAWKEVKALETLLRDRLAQIAPEPEPEPEAEPEASEVGLLLAGGIADHQHEVSLVPDDIVRLERGEEVWATSTQVEGHNLQVSITAATLESGLVYSLDTCKTGGVPSSEPHKCQDGHSMLSADDAAR